MSTAAILKISYGGVTLLAILIALVSPTVGFYLSFIPLFIAFSLFFFKSKMLAALFIACTLIILGPLTTCVSLYSAARNFMNESSDNHNFVVLSYDIVSNSSLMSTKQELAINYIQKGLEALQNNDKEGFQNAVKELQVIEKMPSESK